MYNCFFLHPGTDENGSSTLNLQAAWSNLPHLTIKDPKQLDATTLTKRTMLDALSYVVTAALLDSTWHLEALRAVALRINQYSVVYGDRTWTCGPPLDWWGTWCYWSPIAPWAVGPVRRICDIRCLLCTSGALILHCAHLNRGVVWFSSVRAGSGIACGCSWYWWI